MNISESDKVDPTRVREWNETLQQNGIRSVFLSAEWANVLAQSYRYRPVYLTRLEGKALELLIPFMEVNSFFTARRGVSLPFSDSSDTVVNNGFRREEIVSALVKFGKEAGWNSFELREGKIFSDDQKPSSAYYSHTLDLTPRTELLFEQLSSSTRRNVRKAVREGITIKFLNSHEAVKIFYHLNCLTRKRHGLPPQPMRFFTNIFENLVKKDMGNVALAFHNGTPVAGAIFLTFGKDVFYKFGASDIQYQNLRPNDLVMWETIRHYSERGFQRLDLGRTEMSNEGLRRFKAGWGAAEATLYYYKYDLKKDALVQSAPLVKGSHNYLFRILPVFLSKIVGTVLYRHFG